MGITDLLILLCRQSPVLILWLFAKMYERKELSASVRKHCREGEIKDGHSEVKEATTYS